MILYAVLNFVFAAVLLVTGAIVALGDYEAIYDFYLWRVTDLKGYAKKHGLAMMGMGLPFIACGVLMLVKPEMPMALIGLGVLLLGFLIGFAVFNKIQKKYNGGMF